MILDLFQVEPDPTRKRGWRIVRVENGERHPLPQRFNAEHTARRRAYELQIRYERRHLQPVYLGD